MFPIPKSSARIKIILGFFVFWAVEICPIERKSNRKRRFFIDFR
jgi:hypothetical protein